MRALDQEMYAYSQPIEQDLKQAEMSTHADCTVSASVAVCPAPTRNGLTHPFPRPSSQVPIGREATAGPIACRWMEREHVSAVNTYQLSEKVMRHRRLQTADHDRIYNYSP